MSVKTTIKSYKVHLRDLDRETLYKLFINSSAQSLEVDMLEKKKTSLRNNTDVRYREEKLLFLSLLMDYDLENQIERRKNAKYDYMIGLLLCIASNPRFKYTFGYFKDNIQIYDNKLIEWSKFLNAVILDIKSLSDISLSKLITVEFGGVLTITMTQGWLNNVKIELDQFDKVFDRINSEYDFCILIDNKIIDTGKSNGTGVVSNLHKSFVNLKAFVDTCSDKYKFLISSTHGH